jgi:catechol 2,3-dioxygenase-like lactoylglutathione lyase family enzyme
MSSPRGTVGCSELCLVSVVAASVPQMDMKLELVAVPVTDVDRAKAFYVEQVGFVADYDHTVSDEVRFVQLTPPGSACSIAIGQGLTAMTPGSLDNLQLVIADADAARAELAARGVDVSEVDDQPWGRFVFFRDPDGNRWSLQQLPAWSKGAGGSGQNPDG